MCERASGSNIASLNHQEYSEIPLVIFELIVKLYQLGGYPASEPIGRELDLCGRPLGRISVNKFACDIKVFALIAVHRCCPSF